MGQQARHEEAKPLAQVAEDDPEHQKKAQGKD
jgi:hypothetical protein